VYQAAVFHCYFILVDFKNFNGLIFTCRYFCMKNSNFALLLTLCFLLVDLVAFIVIYFFQFCAV